MLDPLYSFYSILLRNLLLWSTLTHHNSAKGLERNLLWVFQILDNLIFSVLSCPKCFKNSFCSHFKLFHQLSHNINKLCFLMRPRLIYGDLNFFIARTYKTFGETTKAGNFSESLNLHWHAIFFPICRHTIPVIDFSPRPILLLSTQTLTITVTHREIRKHIGKERNYYRIINRKRANSELFSKTNELLKIKKEHKLPFNVHQFLLEHTRLLTQGPQLW